MSDVRRSDGNVLFLVSLKKVICDRARRVHPFVLRTLVAIYETSPRDLDFQAKPDQTWNIAHTVKTTTTQDGYN